MNNSLKVFSGAGNKDLASKVCCYLGQPLGDAFLHQFPNGENYCQFRENIRGADVFIIQPFSLPANDRVMELLIMSDAARRASAGRITAVVPYFGYARQDRKEKSRVPISAKLVMDLIAAAGINRVVTMDLHSPQVAGFTNLPFDHLYGIPSLVDELVERDIDIVIAPDTGAIKRATKVAELIDSDFGFINKKRVDDNTVVNQSIIGDVRNKKVLIVDDMTESCGTLLESAKTCKENGAITVDAAVTHALFNDIARQRLSVDGYLDTLYYTNTTPQTDIVTAARTKLVDVSPVFAKAIQCIHDNESVTELFNIKGY